MESDNYLCSITKANGNANIQFFNFLNKPQNSQDITPIYACVPVYFANVFNELLLILINLVKEK